MEVPLKEDACVRRLRLNQQFLLRAVSAEGIHRCVKALPAVPLERMCRCVKTFFFDFLWREYAGE